jgi:hypothetical protein
MRIEAVVLSGFSLQLMGIPRSVRFIHGSVFMSVELLENLIERGHEKFVLREDLLTEIVDHNLIRNFSSSSSVIIRCNIEIFGLLGFFHWKSFLFVSFESNSHLT